MRSTFGMYSRQLVFLACGYWLWHYFGSITQRQAWSISETARAASTVYLGAIIEPQSSRNAGAASAEFLCVFYGDRLTTEWMSRYIFTCETLKTESLCWIRLGGPFTDVSSIRSILVSRIGIPPLVQSQHWLGVALDPTVWEGGWNTVGCLTYNICLASLNQICIYFSKSDNY